MRETQKVFYYHDELQDEFSGDHIKPRRIDGSYRYIRNDFRGKLYHGFWYRIVAIPLAKLYMKLHFHHRIVNQKVLQHLKGTGYYMYGNHTHFLADALIPTLVNRPVEVSVIVHANNVSMPVLGRITPYLGALPLPDDGEAAKHFMQALQYHVDQKECVCIYPEAHIWPYYTDIRPFLDTSFRYPVQQKLPVFSMTNTYRKRRHGKTPQIVTYIDGPFYPDPALPAKKQKEDLRNQVYAAMKRRARNNTQVLIRYEKI
jgi:1-acyl-sn-glycerol-3-phosphate acyltransferase